MTKEIQLTQGQVALVDDEDYEWLLSWKWYFCNNRYAARQSARVLGKQNTIRMHNAIMRPPQGMVVDHVDLNGLNNQKYNLRICTPAQNVKNVGKYSCNTSGFKGVFISGEKWISKIRVTGKTIYIGTFETKEEAALAYDKAAAKYHGDFSRTNF